MMRHLSLARGGLAGLLLAALAGAALAANDLPPPKAGGDAMPPVQLTITSENGAAKCEPAELRLPANSNVALEVTNRSSARVTLTAPQIFQNKNVLHHDGDVVHVASNDAYLVKENGTGEIRLRTIGPGEYTFGCTSVTAQSKPFEGKLTLVDPTPR
ncbi:cupredoxin domain-containing protein [Methylobacterium sp. WSM2598]|uniref:cupredoxin domain-containing protein n=1 Tax=Methylobacterium sp. WSM2598 TaxID=398261 RepID=UPI00037FC0A3|nr:cupredoxin domain-containing protein [Methylobacterium sp. WSM2598]